MQNYEESTDTHYYILLLYLLLHLIWLNCLILILNVFTRHILNSVSDRVGFRN